MYVREERQRGEGMGTKRWPRCARIAGENVQQTVQRPRSRSGQPSTASATGWQRAGRRSGRGWRGGPTSMENGVGKGGKEARQGKCWAGSGSGTGGAGIRSPITGTGWRTHQLSRRCTFTPVTPSCSPTPCARRSARGSLRGPRASTGRRGRPWRRWRSSAARAARSCRSASSAARPAQGA